jgi:hypothetical protein
MRKFEIKPLSNGDRKERLLQHLHFIKLLIIIAADRSHDPVPKQKVQTIIALKELVMLVMVHRGIDPFTKPVPAESFGINFPAQVAVDVIYDREKKENEKVQRMNGNGKQENHKNPYLYNSFQWMKCISGPG